MHYRLCPLMATASSHSNILQELLLTPLSHFPKRTPLTPPSMSPFPLSTSPPSNCLTPLLPCLLLDLSVHPPQPLTSPTCSDNSESTLRPPSHLMDNLPLVMILTYTTMIRTLISFLLPSHPSPILPPLCSDYGLPVPDGCSPHIYYDSYIP
jgi:hypothetical protein